MKRVICTVMALTAIACGSTDASLVKDAPNAANVKVVSGWATLHGVHDDWLVYSEGYDYYDTSRFVATSKERAVAYGLDVTSARIVYDSELELTYVDHACGQVEIVHEEESNAGCDAASPEHLARLVPPVLFGYCHFMPGGVKAYFGLAKLKVEHPECLHPG